MRSNQKEQLFISLQDSVDLGEACPSPSTNITQYLVFFQSVPVVHIEYMSPSQCSTGSCKYTYWPASNLLNGSVPSSYDSVSVAAENVVGVGAARNCTMQTISELTLGYVTVPGDFFVAYFYCIVAFKLLIGKVHVTPALNKVH